MKRVILFSLLIAYIASVSCDSSSQIKNGFYEIDKETSIKMISKPESDLDEYWSRATSVALSTTDDLFQIKKDSLIGYISGLGDGSILRYRLLRNKDTLVIITHDENFKPYFLATKEGLTFNVGDLGVVGNFKNSERTSLTQYRNAGEMYEMHSLTTELDWNQNLGQWDFGSLDDEFDNFSDKEYYHTVVEGRRTDSNMKNVEILVKMMIKDQTLHFELYQDKQLIPHFPPICDLGQAKVVYSSGKVESEDIFLHGSMIKECKSPDGTLIFNHLKDSKEPIIVVLELPTVGRNNKKIYEFEIEAKGLKI